MSTEGGERTKLTAMTGASAGPVAPDEYYWVVDPYNNKILGRKVLAAEQGWGCGEADHHDADGRMAVVQVG